MGLCLSETEGACWSSGEYLLSGIPVVSTHSAGGRALWYNIDNSTIVNDNEIAVKDGVNSLIKKQFSSKDIRSDHINKQVFFRNKFKKHLSSILSNHNIVIDVDQYFAEHFIDKMYSSVSVDTVINTFQR